MASASIVRAAPSHRAELWQQLLRNPALVIWALFVFLSPIYVVANGLPQPGDALVLILIPVTIATWDRRLDPASLRTLRPLLIFTVWVFLVDYGWAVILDRLGRLKDFLIHPFFYLFNVCIFFSALAIARRGRERFVRVTVSVVYVSVFVQVIVSFFYRTGLNRGVLFFNTPNQLGYYALLAACLFALTQRPLATKRLVSGLGITCCAYLATLSASRAALGGIAVLLFVLVFSSPKTIILASLGAVVLLNVPGPISTAIDNAEYRASALSRHGTFSEERGYDRIWNHPEYLITGAGEGAYERFVKPGEQGRELHSSFGSVLFGYGIFGTILFIVFFARLFKGAALRDSFMLVPALSFAVAHQGLRFTMFWVVLAIFAVLKQIPKPK